MFCRLVRVAFPLRGDSSPVWAGESRFVQLQLCIIRKGTFVSSDWADAVQRKEQKKTEFQRVPIL